MSRRPNSLALSTDGAASSRRNPALPTRGTSPPLKTRLPKVVLAAMGRNTQEQSSPAVRPVGTRDCDSGFQSMKRQKVTVDNNTPTKTGGRARILVPDTPPGQAVAKPKSPPPYAILADDTYDDSSERTSLKRSYASLVSSSPRSGPAVPVTVRGPLPSPARPSPRKPVARAGPALPAPRPPAPRSTSSSAPGAALSTAAPIGPLPNSCLIPFSRSIYPTCATGSVLHALDGHPVLGGVLASLATSSSPLAAAVGVDLQARKQARAPHVPVATIGILSEVLQGYTRHEQQDAGEVLGAVLQDAVVQAHAPGVLHTTHMERRCLGPTCRSRTLTPATSDVILHVAPSIEAPSSVQAALGSFGSPHHIGLRCGNGCVEGAEQRSVLALLPDSLVVSLARFDSDGRTLNNGLGPVDEQVTLVEDTSGTSAIYDLYSVVAHRGNTMHSGHYVAVCRERDGVVLFDDDSATRHAGFDAAMRKCAAVPYLHLYHRRRVDSDAHAGRSASSSSPMPELPVPPDRFLALNAQSGPAAESATSAVEGVGDTPEAQPLAQPERPSVAGPARSRRRRRSGATRRRSAVANGKDKAPQQQEESDGAFQGSQEDPSNARPSSSTINPSSRINARTTPTKTSSLSHVEYIPVVYRVSSGDFKFTPPVLNDLVNRVRRFTSAALVATGQFGDDQADLERRLTPVFSRRTGRKRVENWRTPSGVPWAYSVERFLAAIKVGDLPVVVLIGSSMPNPLSLRLVASRTSQIVKLRSSDIDSDEHLILDGGRLASILDALFGHLGELSLSPVPTLRELAAAHSHLAQAVETVQDLFDRDTELEVAITTFESFFRRRMSSAWALRLNVQNEVRRFFIGNVADDDGKKHKTSRSNLGNSTFVSPQLQTLYEADQSLIAPPDDEETLRADVEGLNVTDPGVKAFFTDGDACGNPPCPATASSRWHLVNGMRVCQRCANSFKENGVLWSPAFSTCFACGLVQDTSNGAPPKGEQRRFVRVRLLDPSAASDATTSACMLCAAEFKARGVWPQAGDQSNGLCEVQGCRDKRKDGVGRCHYHRVTFQRHGDSDARPTVGSPCTNRSRGCPFSITKLCESRCHTCKKTLTLRKYDKEVALTSHCTICGDAVVRGAAEVTLLRRFACRNCKSRLESRTFKMHDQLDMLALAWDFEQLKKDKELATWRPTGADTWRPGDINVVVLPREVQRVYVPKGISGGGGMRTQNRASFSDVVRANEDALRHVLDRSAVYDRGLGRYLSRAEVDRVDVSFFFDFAPPGTAPHTTNRPVPSALPATPSSLLVPPPPHALPPRHPIPLATAPPHAHAHHAAPPPRTALAQLSHGAMGRTTGPVIPYDAHDAHAPAANGREGASISSDSDAASESETDSGNESDVEVELADEQLEAPIPHKGPGGDDARDDALMQWDLVVPDSEAGDDDDDDDDVDSPMQRSEQSDDDEVASAAQGSDDSVVAAAGTASAEGGADERGAEDEKMASSSSGASGSEWMPDSEDEETASSSSGASESEWVADSEAEEMASSSSGASESEWVADSEDEEMASSSSGASESEWVPDSDDEWG